MMTIFYSIALIIVALILGPLIIECILVVGGIILVLLWLPFKVAYKLLEQVLCGLALLAIIAAGNGRGAAFKRHFKKAFNL